MNVRRGAISPLSPHYCISNLTPLKGTDSHDKLLLLHQLLLLLFLFIWVEAWVKKKYELEKQLQVEVRSTYFQIL